RRLGSPARMGDGAMQRIADLLGVFPYVTGLDVDLVGLPALPALFQFSRRELDVDGALVGVDLDDIAVADERDRAPDRRFRPDVADAEASRRPGEPAVGDQGHLTAGALAVERGGRRQHLTHARAAPGAFIANDEHVAFLVLARLDRGESILLAVEATRRSGECQLLHAGHLHDRALRREIAFQANDAARLGDRLVGRTDHVLTRIPFHALEILRDGAPG